MQWLHDTALYVITLHKCNHCVYENSVSMIKILLSRTQMAEHILLGRQRILVTYRNCKDVQQESYLFAFKRINKLLFCNY